MAQAAITHTAYGPILTASIIHIMRVKTVRNGYGQDAPTLQAAIGLSPAGHWMPLYETGGDWASVSENDDDAALDLGSMDDRRVDRMEHLNAGARWLRVWAARVGKLDPDNESLMEMAAYLNDAATRADQAARE